MGRGILDDDNPPRSLHQPIRPPRGDPKRDHSPAIPPASPDHRLDCRRDPRRPATPIAGPGRENTAQGREESPARPALHRSADLRQRRVRQPRAAGARLLQGRHQGPRPARRPHPRRGLGQRRQGRRRRTQEAARQRDLGRVDQLSLHHPGPGRRDQTAGEVAAGGCGAGRAVPPIQGERMEHRQDPDRRDRRLGRRLLVALARLPRRHGPARQPRPRRPRVRPA